MRNFYIEQSSNRYTVNGDVTDWVQVPFNEANYGANYCGGIVCARTWLFVRDAANAWYNAQIAAGKTKARDQRLPVAVRRLGSLRLPTATATSTSPTTTSTTSRSSTPARARRPAAARRAPTRSGATAGTRSTTTSASTGPPGAKLGGVRIGESDYWIGDYTVEPENGGVGVFAHEFGHDLGLPDLYDTSGNTGGAENSTGFWTLYSSGSYGSTGMPADGIGSKPIPMSAYEKIFLGWSNYQLVGSGSRPRSSSARRSANTKQAQQLVVLLPDKEVVTSRSATRTPAATSTTPARATTSTTG